MILSIIEMIILMFFGTISLVKITKGRNEKLLFPAMIVIITCACFAHIISRCIPIEETSIELTALNKYEAGSTGQLYLENFVVDGATYPIKDAVQGKWFWMDGRYCWLEEDDPRLKEEITSRILLKMPAGIFQKISFVSNEWKGLVQINYKGDIKIVDTAVESTVSVGSSPNEFLIYAVQRAIAFMLILALLSLPAMIVLFALEKRKGTGAVSTEKEAEPLKCIADGDGPATVGGRLVWIELLRLVGSLGIILLHIAAQYFLYLEQTSVAWHVANFFHGITRYGVPVFLMITGVLYFSRPGSVSVHHLFKDRIVNYFIHYVFWAIFYAWLASYLWWPEYTPLQTLKAIMKSAITEPKGPLWYLLALIEILILLPVIKPALQSENGKRLCEYILGVWFVFAVIKGTFKFLWFIPKLDYILLMFNKVSVYSLGRWMGFCVLGYYLYQYGIPWIKTPRHRLLLYVAGAIGIFVGVILTAIYCRMSGVVHESFYDNFSIAQVIFTVAIFIFFKEEVSTIRFREETAKEIVYFSSLTMGVYLIHSMWINVLGELDTFGMTSFYLDPIGNILLRWYLTIVLSFMSVCVLKKIPFIRKYIV